MMPELTERLEIRDFGPLHDVFINLKPITLLIGSSGSGKSTLMKVAAICRHIVKKYAVRAILKEFGKHGPNLPRLRLESYLKNASFNGYLREMSRIAYVLEYQGKRFSLVLDRRGIHVEGDAPPGFFAKIAFIADTRNALSMWTEQGARSAARGLRAFDFYFNETYDLWEDALAALGSETLSAPFFSGISMSTRKDAFHRQIVEIVSKADQYKIALSMAASGMKTSFPIFAILHYLGRQFEPKQDLKHGVLDSVIDLMAPHVTGFFYKSLEEGGLFAQALDARCQVFVHLEEPEMNLDPATQVNLLKEMIRQVQSCATDRSMNLFFATHSPYLLTALNNEIMKVKALKGPDNSRMCVAENAGGPCPLPDAVVAYELQSGHCVNLIDKDTGLIAADAIDRISTILDEEFTSYLDRMP